LHFQYHAVSHILFNYLFFFSKNSQPAAIYQNVTLKTKQAEEPHYPTFGFNLSSVNDFDAVMKEQILYRNSQIRNPSDT